MIDNSQTGMPCPETLKRWLERLAAFGPRLTGWSGHQDYISFLKEKLAVCGFEVHSDHYEFTRWEPLTWGISPITGDGTSLNGSLPGVFYYPYSGSTGPDGLEAELAYCPRENYRHAAGKIALVDVRVPSLPARLLISPRSAFPEGTPFSGRIRHPVVGSLFPGLNLEKAKQCGVLGVVGIWRGLPNSVTENQYLPFTTPLMDCPALWVNNTTGDRLKRHTATGGKVKFTLHAEITAKAKTESFYTVLPGKIPFENILVTTHTDGPNSCEENGGLGLLALARHFAAKPVSERQRGLVFLFVTGHFQLPQFAQNKVQASAIWLKAHPELWDGQNTNQRAVAGITLEHLGALERKTTKIDQVGAPTCTATAMTDPEYVYVSNKALNAVYLESLKKRRRARGFTLRPSRPMHFGEGSVLHNANIPTISLIPMPAWLCAVEDSAHPLPGLVDADLMLDQINGFIAAIERLDRMSVAEIGPNDHGLLPNIPAALSALPELAKSFLKL